MSKPDINKDSFDIFADYNPAYSDDFTERVMQKVVQEKKKETTTDIEFYNVFKMVALSGAAAIIILLFTVYLTEGSFSADAFSGLVNYSPDEPLIMSFNF